MKNSYFILTKIRKKALFAFCFTAFAINAGAQTNDTVIMTKIENDKVSIQKAQSADIVNSDEMQVNASVEIAIVKDTSFTENEETKQFYPLYPGFPEYVDTGNKEKDMNNYNIAVNEWAKNNKAEFKKMLKEQLKNQKTENDMSKIKKQD